MADSEVYLFTGPENGDKSDAVATIRAAAEKKNGGVDFYRYYASETRITDVISQLQNASLFSSALFIILKNGFSVADDAVELILDMVENNTETLKSECSRFFYG